MTKARDLANAADVLDDVSATELSYVNGVTSAIQTQLNAKQAVVSGVDDTEIGYLNGVTSAIQTQIDSKIGSASAISPTLIDAKGDLIVGSAADTAARLAVGTNDYVLTADSSATNGVKWAAASSGAMVLTKEQSFTTSSAVNVNDCFSTTYKNYLIVINNTAISGNFDLNFRLRVSGSDNTTSNYNHSGAYFAAGDSPNTALGSLNDDKWDVGNSIGIGFYQLWLHAPFASEATGFEAINGSKSRLKIKGGMFDATTSFTGFSLLPTSNNMTGTLRVYGLVDA